MKRVLISIAAFALCAQALAGNYVGDYAPGDTVDCNFGTVRPSTGASFTLAGSPVISAYKDNSATQVTTGITLTADFDGVTGLNHVRVTTASDGTHFSAGSFQELIITTGTVDSISVTGQPVCSFTLRKGTIAGVPAATAGAAGGLQIAGSNAATTYATLTVTGTTTLSDGLVVARSTSNQPAATFTGNGTGNGITVASGSGATGTGLAISSAATNGAAIALAGAGTGNGLTATGGATGNGISGVGGATSGNGIRAAGTAGNSVALNLVGQGSAAGLLSTGGATGAGISAVGGSTSGAGISATATSGAGLSAAGGTAGAGILATGGATGHGVSAVGGSTSGDGVRAVGTAGNSNAMNLVGQGSANGLLSTGGATGHGMRLIGGATSGNGLSTSFTAPSACSAELGTGVCGTLSGTHSSTQADLGTNAPGTISDLPGTTIYFPTRNVSRSLSAYDTATGIATWTTALDADVTLTNGDPWLLWATAPGTASGSSNVTQIEGVDATDALDARIAAAGLATASALTTHDNKFGTPSNLGSGATFAANNVDIESQTDDIGVAGAGLTAADDAVMTRLGTPVGASLSVDIAGVESGISWNPAWDSEVQSEANDALVANLLDQLLLNTYNPASPPGATDSLLEDLVENDAGVTRFTSNALEQAPTSGGGNMTQIEGVDATDALDARIAAAGLATASALTTHDNKFGTPSNLGSGATFAANNVDIESQTDDIGVAGAGLTAADDATLAAIANVPAAVGTRQIPDSYSADGAQPTTDQALLTLLQVMTEAVMSGNQILIKKPDGTTTAITLTLAPSADNPVSRTRTQ